MMYADYLYLLSYFFTFANAYVLVYHTENSHSMQYYGCVYYTASQIGGGSQCVKYCRQLNESQPLQRDFNQSCHHDAKQWSFEELSDRNISVADVLKWSSSMEQADRYAKYLSNSSLELGDHYICNCTNPATFGKFCEYEFYYGSTSFDMAIENLVAPLKKVNNYFDTLLFGSQLHNNRPCYTTWTCDSGLMCLDWRHICDGKQQCMDGLDEDYCELLEFNECEDDEYRCANGMCIPEEYWLDGDYDCMDWTDEYQTIVDTGNTCWIMPSFNCDEHFCPQNQWSCGDGQCVYDGTDRHQGIRSNIPYFCKNFRDVNYMCEATTRNSKPLWTIDGGYCLPYRIAYQKLGLEIVSNTSLCAMSVKCGLSGSLNQDCPCRNPAACSKLMNESCPDVFVPYPESGPVLSAYIGMMYTRGRDWSDNTPERISYYGRIKCLGYQLITKGIRRWSNVAQFYYYRVRLSHYRICNMDNGTHAYFNFSGPRYDINCWNDSKTFNNRSYQVSQICQIRCISKYRVRDGIFDCHKPEDTDESLTLNNSCPNLQRHRLQCSPSKLSCLLAAELGNWFSSCSNERDEFDQESGTIIDQTINCQQRHDPGCRYLRDYIRRSSEDETNKTIDINQEIIDDQSTIAIPFENYCNSFFNMKSGFDESPQFCKQWVCPVDQYQCVSGQCILQIWVCDGEWDCTDGSDEQGIFTIDHFEEHNARLIDLDDAREQCSQRYRANNTPFSDICDISSEYPCFRTGIDNPFNLTLNRPCINLTQIGDEKIDCLSGLDERNLLQCSGRGRLGFHFQFNDGVCITYDKLCRHWTPGVDIAYDTVCFYQERRFRNGTMSECNGPKDVMCLDNVCVTNARCDGKIDCLHGEDEYRCVPNGESLHEYREYKKKKQLIRLRLQDYPSATHVSSRDNPSRPLASVNTLTTSSTTLLAYEIVREALPKGTITFEEHYLPFICNRGIPVRYYTGDTICLCPPSAYGLRCEFYSDRITVITHLDLTNYRSLFHPIAIIKVLTTFLFDEQILDYYEFHVNPHLHNANNYVKQSIYFLYPRTKEFIRMKQNDRNGTQLYSVRFEAFHLHRNGTIEPNGVWLYPIYFDFLPVFRLPKILRFHPSVNNPCSVDRCGQHGICQEIINSNHSSYFCSCHNGYYGKNCTDYESECNHYCSSNSICKPKHRGNLTHDQHPLCLCPASTFGHSCHLTNYNCPKNPCLNGGSCVVTYDLFDTNNYICICTDLFTGDHCQYPKGTVDISLVLSSNSSNVIATTVSYNDYHNESLRFVIRHQQVYDSLPSHLQLAYSQKLTSRAPIVAILRMYGSNYLDEEPEYYLLYYYSDQKDINITIDLTSENHCPIVQPTDIPEYSGNSSTAVFYYHQMCQSKRISNSTFTCFRDLNYLCVCEVDHYRADCFGYNRSVDQCSLCLSNGYCLKGELEVSADFFCLCPRCHHGRLCQYSTEFMSFTLDSLIVKDIQRNLRVASGIYISVAIIVFLFGFFNNSCSFLTFIRPKPRRIGVGNYLLVVSIVDQCSLLFLLLKVIHIIFSSNGTLFNYERLNLYSCKIVSYLLSVSTRITYWLTSFVTLERLYTVLFPTSVKLKKPRLALTLSMIAILIISGMHVHEILHYILVIDPSYTSTNVTLCVTNYTKSWVSTYNHVNILIHYFIPFLIQVISITILIVQITLTRARTRGSNQETFLDVLKKQLKTHKEQYVTPITIIFSSLPQAILSFSYACTELKQAWQRYTLLTTYLLSYLPPMLGFILYVLSSTTFSQEFRQTMIGKRLLGQQRAPVVTNRQGNIEVKTGMTKPFVSSYKSRSKDEL